MNQSDLNKNISTEVSEEEIKNGVKDEYGGVYSADGSRLLKFDNDTVDNYSVKEGCKVICDEAFNKCERIESVVLPEEVTSIGNSAFNGCENLKSIALPDGVTSIGIRAFWRCESLESIVLPNGVKFIGYGAFYGCESLKSIVLPDGVISIGDYAFNGCIQRPLNDHKQRKIYRDKALYINYF